MSGAAKGEGRDDEFSASAAERLKPLLATAKTAVLATHVTPDGDGIGAEICLQAYLADRGIEARIFNTEATPLRYRFLDERNAVEVYDEAAHGEFLRSADLLFMLDNSAPSRFGPLEKAARASRAVTVCIDHHNITDPFWKVNLIDSSAAATGEMVYRIVEALGGRPDFTAAQAAYVSLVTDTGSFRFGKTAPRSHRLAADLLEAGVSPPRVHEEVYERSSAALVRLAGVALAGLSLGEGNRLGWITLTLQQVRDSGGMNEDTSDVVNELLTIDGVRLAVLLKELEGGKLKLSFRSKGTLDVNRIAQSFGGGGHTNASGAVIAGTIAERLEEILQPCRALLQSG
ncbi:MAG TPA: bifunctional oligoribonuclease/PAP phosphatase NrnA [Candidatus Polarisedimenticolia bacterium]|nr:bifunctional oligoribonuclease/PAP phosphatase NrnA [Candidatus Polarisedimenticolia bacterium]